MQDNPQDTKRKERDDFWDADNLLPKDAQHTRRHTFSVPTKRSTTAVEMEIPPLQASNDEGGTTVTVAKPQRLPQREARADHGGGAYPTAHGEMGDEPELVYEAEGCLMHTVKVYPWRTGYHYFDQFVGDAQRYAAMKGVSSPKQPFFSYFPQYAQMNRRQLAWYLWWRDNARDGVYMETDYAYILLYIFELINLPAQEEEAKTFCHTMARIWMVYRKAYPQLDHYMCEWLCDYCLIHRLAAPVEVLLPALGEVIEASRLKEFYLSGMITVGDEAVNLASARILLSFCCQYDYRKSKFATGEHKALFDTLIPGAIAATFPLVIGNREGSRVMMDDSYMSRDAYVGALCAYSNKRRIEISYTSFSRSHDLRFLIGDMVRHVENVLRGCIGVRSKLTTHFLDTPMKEALNAWLAPRLPRPVTHAELVAKNTPRPMYEALYDLPHTEVSIEQADAIEQSSWETTRILTEAFAETCDEEMVTHEEAPTLCDNSLDLPLCHDEGATESTSTTDAQDFLKLLGEYLPFLQTALRGDRAGQLAYCREQKQMPDAIADIINDITLACEFFDIVLEDDGDMYVVVDDYKERLNQLLEIQP